MIKKISDRPNALPTRLKSSCYSDSLGIFIISINFFKKKILKDQFNLYFLSDYMKSDYQRALVDNDKFFESATNS